VDSLFRVSHTDPWLQGDPHRTSRTINFQNTRTSGNAIHGRAQDEVERDGAADDSGPDSNVVVARLMGAVEYGRPLASGAQD
jgi:outer membrane protein insertion porin family